MTMTGRLRITKNILWLITGFGAVAAVARLLHGLGATTALTDSTPWGIWIGFDVMGGVALAASGFVIAGAVYIFHLEKLHPLVRPAVLSAFLGYLAVIVGLVFDIGRPWMIWSPIIHWQFHSPLFEVAWCVILYTTVLAFEFAPVALEKLPVSAALRAAQFLRKRVVLIPLVILGIMLSTMHQSTLGTLFVILPFRVHPLWYTSWLPLLFFVSAVALGLAMVICESTVSSWLYQRGLEEELLAKVAGAMRYVLIVYLVLIFTNLSVHGKLGLLFDGSWESILYWFEISISALIPVVLLSIPRVRSKMSWRTAAAALVAIGFVINRIDLAVVSMFSTTGYHYFPSWMEIAITLGIVSTAVLVYLFFVEHCDVYEKREEPQQEIPKPVFDSAFGSWIIPNPIRNASAYLLFFLIGASISFSLLPQGALHGAVPEKTPISRPRGLTPMIIDGDRANLVVIFDHSRHIREQGMAESCIKCHHLQKPMDTATSCSECHKDMFLKTMVFDHLFHERKLGGNKSCYKCHDENLPKAAEYSKRCGECHKDWETIKGSRVVIKTKGPDRFKYAPGYMDAMHDLCIPCHQEKAEEYRRQRLMKEKLASASAEKELLAEVLRKERLHFCRTCHKEVKYTKEPIPEVVIPPEIKGGQVVLPFLGAGQPAGESAGKE